MVARNNSGSQELWRKKDILDEDTVEVLRSIENAESSVHGEDVDLFFSNFAGSVEKEYTDELFCQDDVQNKEETHFYGLETLEKNEVLHVPLTMPRKTHQECATRKHTSVPRRRTRRGPKVFSLEEADLVLKGVSKSTYRSA